MSVILNNTSNQFEIVDSNGQKTTFNKKNTEVQLISPTRLTLQSNNRTYTFKDIANITAINNNGVSGTVPVDITLLNDLLKKYFKNVQADPFIEINTGGSEGSEMVNIVGKGEGIGATEIDLWTEATSLSYLTSAETMDVVSSDTVNDISTGIGSRSVIIRGLDGSFNRIEETVTLLATPVTTIATFIRVFPWLCEVVDAGTYGGSNLGKITIDATTATTTQASIAIGEGRGTGSHYTIPAGKTGYLQSGQITSESNKVADVHLVEREGAEIIIAPFKASKQSGHWHGIDGFLPLDFKANHVFPEKTDIRFTGAFPSPSGTITIEYDLLLEDN